LDDEERGTQRNAAARRRGEHTNSEE